MSNIEDMIWARQQAIRETEDPTDTILLQLTQNEACLIAYALLLIEVSDPKLRSSSRKLALKIADVVEVQKNTST